MTNNDLPWLNAQKTAEMTYNDLAAELDSVLRDLVQIKEWNSLGKTLKIAQLIDKILKSYGRE